MKLINLPLEGGTFSNSDPFELSADELRAQVAVGTCKDFMLIDITAEYYCPITNKVHHISIRDPRFQIVGVKEDPLACECDAALVAMVNIDCVDSVDHKIGHGHTVEIINNESEE